MEAQTMPNSARISRRLTLAGIFGFVSDRIFARSLGHTSRVPGDPGTDPTNARPPATAGITPETGSSWSFSEPDSPKLIGYVVAEPCIGVKDTACVDTCPVDCIHPKKDETSFSKSKMLYIDPKECIECGACVPACPVSAIYPARDLPKKWEDYIKTNAKHYERDNS
jgi:NAD-dependent dihydropyrimidine dehydrogenase PreA subunit